MTIARALISVSDKTGLIPFAKFLADRGVELLSTGGTAELLRSNGIAVRDVSDVTNFPEMMDGRVKTLHPLVHGGLLARRDTASHMEAATTHHIGMIDLLIVNLYPFETTLNRTTDFATLVENIDIGGPAMIRSAAKNHASVTVITDVTDYDLIITAMQENADAVPDALRQRLAAKAFARTAAYDTLISSWLTSTTQANPWPEYFLDANSPKPYAMAKIPTRRRHFISVSMQRAASPTRSNCKGKNSATTTSPTPKRHGPLPMPTPP